MTIVFVGANNKKLQTFYINIRIEIVNFAKKY